MAGPITRAPLNMEEFSAIAFIKSSLPTMSTRNDCRPGMSNAFTTPRKLASTNTCQTWTLCDRVSAARMNASSIDATCVPDHDVAAVEAIGRDSAQRRK
jgi:hypothetical protein